MNVTHPLAIDGIDGDPPESEELGREECPIEGGQMDLSEAQARTLALRYGMALSTIREGLCDDPIQSGDREGEPCGRELPCQFHSEDS